MLRLLDTFSGIGGFSLAARWLGGYETVQFVEKEPWCHKILSKHWPDVPIHDDITTYKGDPGSADVICGGFPCQDISQAGKKAGIKEGTRSGLFYQLMRVVCEVRPRFVVMENVAAILDNATLGTVLGELAQAGYDAEWACIPASAVGACHRRDRWWLVAYRAGRDAGTADSSGLRGQRRGAAGDVAGTAGACEADRQQWQRDGDAADDCGAVAAHPHDERRRQRHPPALAAKAGQPAWPDAPRQLNPDWRAYLSQPVIRDRNDGVSDRVARLKALGNAVVPQVAMIPLARVLELAAQG